MAMVNVRAMALEQFGTIEGIYAYYREPDDALALKYDPDGKWVPVDEKLGIAYVEHIHAPRPDNLWEYLEAVEEVFGPDMQGLHNKQGFEIQEVLNVRWKLLQGLMEFDEDA